MIRDGRLCRIIGGHRTRLHRTRGGSAFVTCRICGRRLAFWPSAVVARMVPGELAEHVEGCRHVRGGDVPDEALNIANRQRKDDDE